MDFITCISLACRKKFCRTLKADLACYKIGEGEDNQGYERGQGSTHPN